MPPSGVAMELTTVSSSTRSRRSVPSPLMPPTVTVRVIPLPVTPLMVPPGVPVVVKTKSLASTPVTLSEKVTVKFADGPAVGFGLARTMETTVGAQLSVPHWR
jgi:hypothetical protein